jgi:hypothetical protein
MARYVRVARRLATGVCALLLFAPAIAQAANTNVVRVGVFPFADRSAGERNAPWRRAFPGRLSVELQDATPPRLDVYFYKVQQALTNNAWDGQQPVSLELAGKVAEKLKLERMVLGEFRPDDQGWEVRLQVVEAGRGATPVVLEFKQKSKQDLTAEMAEKVCQALGVTRNPALVEAWQKTPVSNEVLDRLALLNRDGVDSADPERLAALRALVGSEPSFISARISLLYALITGGHLAEAKAEALKVTELAPGLCTGYLGLCESLEGEGTEARREESLLQALKVHPGCPDAAMMLFPYWVSRNRWQELKPVAEKAHAARPDEPAATIALGAALAGLGEREKAWDLINDVDLTEVDEAELHAVLAQTAMSVPIMRLVARELLWLQRQSDTNKSAREYLGQVDATYVLIPRKPPPRNPRPARCRRQNSRPSSAGG